VPYREGQSFIDIAAYFKVWDATRHRLATEFGHEISLEIEPGRFLVAESGYLITEIRAVKRMGGNTFYLVDAGFGVCVVDKPLQLKTDVEQRTAMGTYRLNEWDGLFSLSARQPDGWRTMYVFDLAPQLQSDYELGNWYTSTSPLVPFTSMLVMERVSSDKRYKLVNRRLRIEARDGQVTAERPIGSAEELGQILEETFSVTPPAPVGDIFNRIGG
jgi:arylamine N-acetyltransferase